MLTFNKVMEIFYLIDEFSKEFTITFKKKMPVNNIETSLTGYPIVRLLPYWNPFI
jgi:hypothetical protein